MVDGTSLDVSEDARTSKHDEHQNLKQKNDEEISDTKVEQVNMEDGKKQRKRKSRWGTETDKVDLPGISTELPPSLTQSQLKSYLLHIRLEEINQKLRTGDFGELTPPPKPVFDEQGRKLTPEEQYRKKLEDERSRLVEETIKSNPEFQTDMDYSTWLQQHLQGGGYGNQQRNDGQRRTGMYKYQEKIWIPQREYPDINFIGLLIGPRGNTLKKMENETGAKISIRGKGSLKEGKNDPAALAAADEELHALAMADAPDKVEKAVKIINKIIETAASTPEEANELKKIQLRELASLNGTLRDEDAIVCSNCGQSGHRRFECTERRNVTNNLICRVCGGAGHMANDCLHRDNPEMLQQSRQRMEHIDSEYVNFLAEIGEKPRLGSVATSSNMTPIGGNAYASQWGPPPSAPMGSYPPQHPPAAAWNAPQNPWMMPPPPPS